MFPKVCKVVVTGRYACFRYFFFTFRNINYIAYVLVEDGNITNKQMYQYVSIYVTTICKQYNSKATYRN
jgi:hypothetical protein